MGLTDLRLWVRISVAGAVQALAGAMNSLLGGHRSVRERANESRRRPGSGGVGAELKFAAPTT